MRPPATSLRALPRAGLRQARSGRKASLNCAIGPAAAQPMNHAYSCALRRPGVDRRAAGGDTCVALI